jgi:outer membrane PBP1 activator LpoA protein
VLTKCLSAIFRRVKPLLLAIIVPLALLTACSSEESETSTNQGAKDVAAQTALYIEAQRSGDWNKMCLLLDDASRKALQNNGKLPTAAACAKALSSAPLSSQKALQESTKGVAVVKAVAKGNQGEALVRVPDGQKVIKLYRVDGVWRVSIAS